ncbi:hypothetical protein [Devosia sp.]|uniref:hypothetical protein n=1 Tax=Devosia sp. TaxID=1871048 RepID=UPI002AFEA2D2|nr:hypothetical protein [Devosia sp.]
MIEITAAVTVAVPLISALLFAAFRHPEFYSDHLLKPFVIAPILVLIAATVWFYGYAMGATDQLGTDRAAAAEKALAMANVADARFLLVFGLGCLFFLLIAVTFQYIATVSPYKQKGIPRSETSQP